MVPQVSVIIPTMNRARLLSRAVDSVLSQTYTDFELIIIDGHSTDETRKVVQEYNDPRIRFYLQEIPKNGAQATNEGINRALGKYIAFLDDDDEWHPTKLEKQTGLLDTLPEDYGMVYCWMDYYNNDGEMVNSKRPVLKGNIYKEILVEDRLSGTPTFLVRKSLIDKIGGFDTALIFYDDVEFARRVAKYSGIDFVPETLVNVYVDHGSVRQSDLKELSAPSLVYLYGKYKDDIDKEPYLKAQYLTKCAYAYSVNKDFGSFVKYSLRAVIAYPFTIGKYKTLFKGFTSFFR